MARAGRRGLSGNKRLCNNVRLGLSHEPYTQRTGETDGQLPQRNRNCDFCRRWARTRGLSAELGIAIDVSWNGGGEPELHRRECRPTFQHEILPERSAIMTTSQFLLM